MGMYMCVVCGYRYMCVSEYAARAPVARVGAVICTHMPLILYVSASTFGSWRKCICVVYVYIICEGERQGNLLDN